MATRSGWHDRRAASAVVLMLPLLMNMAAAEPFRFANTFTDGAVLEHSNASLWGFGVPGIKVAVAVSRGGSTVASASGARCQPKRQLEGFSPFHLSFRGARGRDGHIRRGQRGAE